MMSSRDWTNVCLRFTSEGIDHNDVNKQIRDRIIKSGNYMISQSNIGDNVILRPVIANPAINIKHLNGLVEEIVRTGHDVIRGIPPNH